MGLPWTFSGSEAFDTTPIGRLDLGGRWYDVPPLTKGRFDRLLSFDIPILVATLLRAIGIAEGGSVVDAVRTAKARPILRIRGPIERFFRRLVGRRADRLVFDARDAVIPVSADVKAAMADLYDVVAVVAPDVPREAWRAHAGTWEVTELAMMFVEAHDWGTIAYESGLDGAKQQPEGEACTAEAGLVSYCLLVPGYSVQGLLGTRVEGFYRLMNEGRRVVEARNAAARGESGGMSLEDFANTPGTGGGVADPDQAERIRMLWDSVQKPPEAASGG